MPLIYQQDINQSAKIAVWKIEEPAEFFLKSGEPNKEVSHPQKRAQHLAARHLLTLLEPAFPMEMIRILEGGKPILLGGEFQFSISHCDQYASAIVSKEKKVGIDIETITKRVEKIKHKFLHQSELNFVHKLKEDDQIILLTLLWGVKEALYKWLGKTGVLFSQHFIVEAFELQDRGTILASINQAEQTVSLSYLRLNQQWLVWIID